MKFDMYLYNKYTNSATTTEHRVSATITLPENLTILGQVCPATRNVTSVKESYYTEEDVWVEYSCVAKGHKWEISVSLNESPNEEHDLFVMLLRDEGCDGEIDLDSRFIGFNEDSINKYLQELCELAEKDASELE